MGGKERSPWEEGRARRLHPPSPPFQQELTACSRHGAGLCTHLVPLVPTVAPAWSWNWSPVWQVRSQGSGLTQGHSVHSQCQDSRSLRATEMPRWCAAPLQSAWSGEGVMRARNDRRPVLRGHAQGGDGGEADGSGRGSVHRRSTALSAAGARGWGQSRCSCRTVSSEGGASGEVAGSGRHRGR